MRERQLVYNFLRAALTGEKPDMGHVETSEWWSLFRLLQRNHVLALCYDAAVTSGVPREVLLPWLAERQKAVEWHRYQKQVQQEIVDAMASHGIQTMVLKGTHIAQYYPYPETREFGDLDLYFYDRHDEADRVAREVLKVQVSNDSHHHSKYDYRGVTVESHYDFVNVHYPPSNQRYEAMLKEMVPSPIFEVLFLLRHMAVHFAASRLMLRDLVDWTLTCQALEQQVDWAFVQHTVEDFGMKPFMNALSTIAYQRLGYPSSLQIAQGDDASIERLEQDIVYGSPGTDDRLTDGLARLMWKLRRWQALGWKRGMVFNDSKISLLVASLSSHTEKPRSILHKM